MPLLNKRLLEDLIKNNHHLIPPSKIEEMKKHLEQKILARIDNKTFKKEEAEKPVILPKFFDILGYSHPETYEFEFANQSRSADVTLGHEVEGKRIAEVSVEWKGADTKNLDKGKAGETPVSQMWDYMGKSNTDIGIVGNFLEWRLYTKQKGQTEYHEFNLREIVNNDSKLLELMYLLSPAMLLRQGDKNPGIINLIHESENKQAEITKRFYNDYKQKRLNLFEHLVENNQQTETKNSPFSKGVAGDSQTGYLPVTELPKNSNLKQKANELRKAGNLSEVLFWNKIKNKQFLELDFSRQFIIGNYIADFYCHTLNLVVEIDGESHDFKGEYDAERENYLKNLGLNIVHFEDIRIKKDLDNVMQELYDWAKVYVQNNTPPPAEAPLLGKGEFKHLLLEKTQKILDRLIFVLFCEDRFLLPSNTFRETFELGKRNRSRSEIKVWEQFQYLFEDIDKGRYDVNPQINAFNGGLFAEDLELNNLIIKNEIWQDLVKFSDYDFESDLNVNILGHIFEQSISDIEEIKNEIEGETTDKKKSKRKKNGIYYTPEYITDYIVSETVGGWLADQEKIQTKINCHNENIEFLKKEIKEKKINNLQNFKIEFFASSQCNDLYLVTKNDKKYLARITNWEQNKTWKIKQEEYEKLNFIKDLNIAPISHYYDLGQNEKQIHWSLVDFVEGETVKKLSDKNIVQLAQTLKKLHENTIKNKYGDRWFSLEKIPYKSYTLKEYSENKPEFAQKAGYDELKKSFENINWQEIKKFCLIHNDLKPLNMVENNDEILLIDWEYAYMDIPENDIARFFVENSLTEIQKKLFLENYLPLENLDFKMEILQVFVNLYEFFEVGKDVVEPNYSLDLKSITNHLEQIKILDPAGGSGAFPNQVHNFLTKKHEAKFKELSSDENDLFNQVQIDKSILKNNIFMVDLQPESVEIAKLSLWLKTTKKDQKLNNLDENVKVGNSLINDPQLAGDLAFDWEKEFGWLKNDG
jgi:very-short-patch-repair endonuclease/thiamine kinase-like enzyme